MPAFFMRNIKLGVIMFKCKVANEKDMLKKWDYEIKRHPNDDRWLIWKEKAILNAKAGNRICFHGVLDDDIIVETTAIIKKEDSGLENKDLVGENMAYLEAFRVKKEFEGQGYFSKVYRFMEEHLAGLGFKTLVLGVEPTEERNRQIYFYLGFTNFLHRKIETYPPKREGEAPEDIIVDYYSKEI